MADEMKPPAWFESEKHPFTVMQATSADIDAGGKTYVVLTWAAQPGMTGYNIYRTQAGSKLQKRLRPVNGSKPVAPVKTCAQLKAFIPEGSPEWNLLVNSFTALADREKLQVAEKTAPRSRFTDQAALARMRPVPGQESQAMRD